MTELVALECGDLKIEPRVSTDGYDLFWRGRSNERQPARTIGPYLAEFIARGRAERKTVNLHLETVELINSSTITAIIQSVQQARAAGTKLVVYFDPRRKWQKLSFEALSMLVTEDGLFAIKEVEAG